MSLFQGFKTEVQRLLKQGVYRVLHLQHQRHIDHMRDWALGTEDNDWVEHGYSE